MRGGELGRRDESVVGWSEQESWGMDDKLKGEFCNSLKNTWLTSPLVTPPVSLTHSTVTTTRTNAHQREGSRVPPKQTEITRGQQTWRSNSGGTFLRFPGKVPFRWMHMEFPVGKNAFPSQPPELSPAAAEGRA